MEVFEDVFADELLLARILKAVLHEPSVPDYDEPAKTLSLERAQIVRQVSRKWMEVTSQIFLKAGEPLFRITIDSWSPLEDKSKNLEMGLATHYTYWTGIIFPYALTLEKNTFGQFNSGFDLNIIPKTLENLFGRGGLIHLKCHEPYLNSPLLLKLPPLHLQSLLVVIIIPVDGNSTNFRFERLLQSIIDQTLVLKEFRTREARMGTFNCNWNLTYPPTLRRLDGGYELFAKRNPVQDLLKNLVAIKLLNVRNLQKILGILYRCCRNLQELTISYWDHVEKSNLELPLFPIFPKLKLLRLIVPYAWALPVEPVSINSDFAEVFPRLEKFVFHSGDGGMKQILKGWCNPSTSWTSVNSLDLKLWDISNWAPLPVDAMERIGSKFPNIVNLQISLSWENGSVITQVFQEMRQLKTLKLSLEENVIPVTDFELDGLIVGCPPENGKEHCSTIFTKDRFIRRIGSLGNQNGYCYEFRPSIRDLKELKSVLISAKFKHLPRKLSLSRVAFELGFLLVPKLERLEIRGDFRLVAAGVPLRDMEAFRNARKDMTIILTN